MEKFEQMEIKHLVMEQLGYCIKDIYDMMVEFTFEVVGNISTQEYNKIKEYRYQYYLRNWKEIDN